MNPFKSKERREAKKQEKLEDLMESYNLEGLSQEDKEFARGVAYKLSGTGLVRFGANAEDAASIGLMQAMIDQNFLIIKLLNEISNKLDK